MSEARYDTAAKESPEDLLKRAAENLQQESGSIQKQMHALSEEEMSRVKKIAALELIKSSARTTCRLTRTEKSHESGT